MARTGKPYDPLSCIPSADAIRRRLTDTERTAERLRILLETAERIERQGQPSSQELVGAPQ